jgi:hypothetical protein
VTFIAQLMPSRTDVPSTQEYLERIEALVAVVNHRHGTPDWMPIQLKLRDDLEEAFASYKHYDVLLVNAMFDGMNLVAKEGPLSTRTPASRSSRRTPARTTSSASSRCRSTRSTSRSSPTRSTPRSTMDPPSARAGSPGCRRSSPARDPGDWIDEQLDDIAKKAAASARVRAARERMALMRNGANGRRCPSPCRWYHPAPAMADTKPIYDLDAAARPGRDRRPSAPRSSPTRAPRSRRSGELLADQAWGTRPLAYEIDHRERPSTTCCSSAARRS